MSLMSRKSDLHSHLSSGRKHSGLHTVTSGKHTANTTDTQTPRERPFGELKFDAKDASNTTPAYKSIFSL